MVVPLLLDQFYWSCRVRELGIGPGGVNIKGISRKQLQRKVTDLLNNPSYKEKAASIGKLVRSENGLENICHRIEGCQEQGGFEEQDAPEREWA
jgi:UDP:flavonoid glycosyltransferase YjiC (YdhE family)